MRAVRRVDEKQVCVSRMQGKHATVSLGSWRVCRNQAGALKMENFHKQSLFTQCSFQLSVRCLHHKTSECSKQWIMVDGSTWVWIGCCFHQSPLQLYAFKGQESGLTGRFLTTNMFFGSFLSRKNQKLVSSMNHWMKVSFGPFFPLLLWLTWMTCHMWASRALIAGWFQGCIFDVLRRWMA